MKIDVDNPAQLLSHLLLQNSDVVGKVVKTKQFRIDNQVEATVYFNGVKVPAETLEEVLQHFIKCVEDSVDMKGFNDKVQAKAEEILRTRADGILEKLSVLEEVSHSPENFIKPYWEK